jgi:hypothetical protein
MRFVEFQPSGTIPMRSRECVARQLGIAIEQYRDLPQERTLHRFRRGRVESDHSFILACAAAPIAGVPARLHQEGA